MKKLLLLAILPLMVSCQNSNYKYSDTETEQFLNEITKNAKVTIGDFTEFKKQPTTDLYILTRYPLSKKSVDEYNKNSQTLKNKDNDIYNFTTYTFKDYKLTKENGENLQFVDKGRAVYLQGNSLWEYENVLYENLSIEISLNKKYEKLNGYVTIEFIMPNDMKREIKLPVNITIYDKIPE